MRLRLAILLAVASLAALSTGPASAQGLFDMIFGGGEKPRHYVPPGGSAYTDPGQYGDRSYGERPAAPSGSTGRALAYCVRLCDGRFFPIPRQANSTSIQLCNSFCPASKTQVFNGSQIDHAVAPNGARYADLENAFVYRQKIVEGCTCNGKDTFGVARIDVANDPTLRAGDIVATADGTTKVNNAGVSRTARNATRVPPRGAPVQRDTAPDDDMPED